MLWRVHRRLWNCSWIADMHTESGAQRFSPQLHQSGQGVRLNREEKALCPRTAGHCRCIWRGGSGNPSSECCGHHTLPYPCSCCCSLDMEGLGANGHPVGQGCKGGEVR